MGISIFLHPLTVYSSFQNTSFFTSNNLPLQLDISSNCIHWSPLYRGNSRFLQPCACNCLSYPSYYCLCFVLGRMKLSTRIYSPNSSLFIDDLDLVDHLLVHGL